MAAAGERRAELERTTLDLYGGGRYNGVGITLNPMNDPAVSGK